MKNAFLSLLFLLFSISAFSQANYWNIPNTEILIDQNQRAHRDYNLWKEKQMLTTSQTAYWSSLQNQYTKLSDKLKQKSLNLFMLAADATIVYDIVTKMAGMVEIQAETARLAVKHPWALDRIIPRQKMIYKRGEKLYQFIVLLVSSYSDLNRMKVAERKKIYFSLRMDVDVMYREISNLNSWLKRASLADRAKNSQLMQFYNKDKQKVDEILRNMRW